MSCSYERGRDGTEGNYGSWLRVMAYAFENMKAWQDARKLVVEVYRLLDSFLKFKNYALCD